MAGNDRTIRLVLAGDAAGAVKAAKDAEQQLGHLDVRLQAVSTRSIAVGAALGQVLVQGAGRAIGAAKELATAYADSGSLIHDLSQRTGFSAQALSEWKYAADQSGTSIEGLEVGIRKMNNTVVAAVDGQKAQIESLQAVGITVEDLKGKRPEQVFELIVNGLAGVDDEARQSALATELFGRQGTALLPVLKDGADSMTAMRAEARALGLTMSNEDAAAADKFGDELLRMNKAIEGVKFQIGRELLPVLEPMVNAFANWIQQNGASFAQNLAASIGEVAAKTSEVVGWIHDLTQTAPVKIAIELAADVSGNDMAKAALALFIGSRFGLVGTAIGAAFAGTIALGSANHARQQEAEAGGWLTLPNGMVVPTESGLGAAMIAGGAGALSSAGQITSEEAAMRYAEGTAQYTPGWDSKQRAAGGLTTNVGSAGGGSAQTDPLVTAWKAIHAQLQREQQRALMEGGEQQLAEVRATQDEIVRATQEMAERAHQAIGIDMADALKAAFDFVRDQADASAEALKDYAKAIEDQIAAEKALAEQRRKDVFDLTTMLWRNAGSGLSASGAQELARVANLAREQESVAKQALALGASPEQAASLANGYAQSQQTVKVTFSSDLQIAGEP